MVKAFVLVIFLLFIPTYSAFSQTEQHMHILDSDSNTEAHEDKDASPIFLRVIPHEARVPRTRLQGFDPDRPEECSPVGSIRVDAHGNILPGCSTGGDSYNIIDLAKDLYDGGYKGAQCGGIIIATAAVCAVSISFISGCLDKKDDREVPAEVCSEDSSGNQQCSQGSVPAWLVNCGLSLPTTSACVSVAKKVGNYCW